MAFVEPRDSNNPAGVSLDRPPAAPPMKRALATELGRQPGGNAGTSPQEKALNGLKQVEIGFRDLVSLIPDIAPQLGQLMSQLQPLVVAHVAQMSTGMGQNSPPGIMQPPPMAPQAPGPPQGAPQPGM